MIWIYGLVDPETGFVRYVGQSGDPLARLAQHESHAPHALAEWLLSLRARGHRATVVRLEECASVDEANVKEVTWMRQFASQIVLTNDSERGYRVRPAKGTGKSRAARALLDMMQRTGMSQMRLAAEVGIAQQCISKLLSGQSMPRISTALRIQEKYGIGPSEWSAPA